MSGARGCGIGRDAESSAAMAWGRAWVCVCALALGGCALIFPFQRVTVDATPGDASIFVDGKVAGVSPQAPNLRADRDHAIFVKRPGYRPELVILRSLRDTGRPRLEPAAVKVKLLPVVPGHEVEVEVEKSAPAAPEAPRR